ncbi:MULTISPECIES: DUF4198 domain-containing protein [unclassified Hyphomicrobium]|uniref:DUF4198 domain-containing protein n=1 Tax=unclassified Hyphomicrobium TaxID=2619925 RepID=UPI000213E1C2|nr:MULTISPECIES: DUF4198 domain-containing protein [unclassified Hyphomicrobium]CCB65857.1 conserved protein of unknown function; putative exported protein [Hyphomicrobium sp. MC1]
MKRLVYAAAAFAFLIPAAADAHRAWLRPSATVLSAKDTFVTVDAAVSNDLFYFEFRPLPLDGLQITAPDGSTIAPENANSGKLRSTFDIPLKAPGTYRIALVDDRLMAQYTDNGEKKRWRGKVENLKEIPASASDVVVIQSQRRMETFVTAGKTDETALKPVGKGLEMQPITHPNDLVANDEASFRLLLDGKPAADTKIEIVPGGVRYRNQPGDFSVTTDKDGVFKVKWPEAGLYWMEASVTDDKPSVKEASKRRSTYAATLEVLPE